MFGLIQVILGLALALSLPFVAAAPGGQVLDQVILLAAGSTDGRVVLQMPDKRLLELRVGEKLPGTSATLVSVTGDLAVFKERPAADQPPQTIWLRLNGKAERLRIVPDSDPVTAIPPEMKRVPVTLPPASAR